MSLHVILFDCRKSVVKGPQLMYFVLLGQNESFKDKQDEGEKQNNNASAKHYHSQTNMSPYLAHTDNFG